MVIKRNDGFGHILSIIVLLKGPMMTDFNLIIKSTRFSVKTSGSFNIDVPNHGSKAPPVTV